MGSFRNVSTTGNGVHSLAEWEEQRTKGLKSLKTHIERLKKDESMNEVAERCKYVWHHQSQKNKAVMSSP